MNPRGLALLAEVTSLEEEWDRAATPLHRVSYSCLFPSSLRHSVPRSLSLFSFSKGLVIFSLHAHLHIGLTCHILAQFPSFPKGQLFPFSSFSCSPFTANTPHFPGLCCLFCQSPPLPSLSSQSWASPAAVAVSLPCPALYNAITSGQQLCLLCSSFSSAGLLSGHFPPHSCCGAVQKLPKG